MPHRSQVPSEEDAEILQVLVNKHQGVYSKINQELRESHPDLAFGSRSAFFRRLDKLGIPGYRKAALRGASLQLCLEALPLYHKQRGFRGTQHALSLQGIHTTQAAVLDVLRENDPQGLAARRLGQSRNIRRYPIISAGANEQWSVDGHDKLSKHGFGIYGLRDVYSGKFLGLHVFPSNRLATNVHWLYLKTIREAGGFPMQIASDKGSEVGLMFQTQADLRARYSHIDLQDIPASVQLPSIRNITIERAWGVICREVDRLVEQKLSEGLEDGFVPSNRVHSALVWWLFAPLVQDTLDQHCLFHNTYKVRKQREKMNPSGASRQDVYSSPEAWGGLQCLQKFSLDEDQKLAEAMKEIEQGRTLHWLPAEAEEMLCHVKLGLGAGCPSINWETVWTVFYLMLPWVREGLERLLDRA